jgi:hypothetical protein
MKYYGDIVGYDIDGVVLLVTLKRKFSLLK